MRNLPNVREQRPFGYWIKHIDRRIEENFGLLLAEEGLDRRRWQVLNTIAHGPISPDDLDRALAPFVSDREPTMRPHTDQFVARGWAAPAVDGTLTLTDEGQAGHARVAERVRAARARVIDGLSPEDYGTLMGLLERIAGNLDAVAT
jgi:DNA-binding MarR family transcriptional regulator